MGTDFGWNDTKSIVFTSTKAWLIVKRLKSELDIKSYYNQSLASPNAQKGDRVQADIAHHLRIRLPEDLDSEVIRLLRIGFEYSLK